jgi:signal peptidase II
LKKYFWDYAFLLGIAGFIVLVDQLTKYLVRTQLPFAGSWSPFVWLEPYIRIVHWQNTGAAFGMLQGFGFIFAILAVIVSIAILYYFPRVPSNEWAMRLAMAMQLGGAVGNLIDRITVGTVTDFVSVGTFAVFNVADACISVGTVILILAVWDSERRQKKLARANPEQALASTDPPEPPKQVEQTPDSEKHPLE